MANELPAYYDKQATDFVNSPQAVGYISPTWFEFEQQSVLDWLGYNKEEPNREKILDVGCGIGLFSQVLTPHHFVTGLDVSLSQITQARQKGITGIVGSGFCSPFRSDFFDTILLIEVIQHFHPQQGKNLIRELARMVTNEGELVVVGRNHYSVVRKLTAPIMRLLGRQHFRLYGYHTGWLKELMKSLGFVDIQVAFIFPPLRYFQVCSGYTGLTKYIGSSFVIRGKKRNV